MRLRRVIWNPWQSNGKLRNMKSRSFEVLCHKKIQNVRKYTRTGRPDTPSEGVRIHHWRASGPHIQIGVAPGCAPPFAPGCTPPFCTRLPRTFHPPDVHVRNSGAEWERRLFNFSGRKYPDHLIVVYPDGRAAILHSVAVFSWSFLIFTTDILGYFEIFCFRYLLSKSPKSSCSPPIIGFLSY